MAIKLKSFLRARGDTEKDKESIVFSNFFACHARAHVTLFNARLTHSPVWSRSRVQREDSAYPCACTFASACACACICTCACAHLPVPVCLCASACACTCAFAGTRLICSKRQTAGNPGTLMELYT